MQLVKAHELKSTVIDWSAFRQTYNSVPGFRGGGRCVSSLTMPHLRPQNRRNHPLQ